MTGRFDEYEIGKIRRARKDGLRMRTICFAFQGKHTRDEMVEAIWATMRHQNDSMAAVYVNQVLYQQRQGVPLVNGHPARIVTSRPPEWW